MGQSAYSDMELPEDVYDQFGKKLSFIVLIRLRNDINSTWICYIPPANLNCQNFDNFESVRVSLATSDANKPFTFVAVTESACMKINGSSFIMS